MNQNKKFSNLFKDDMKKGINFNDKFLFKNNQNNNQYKVPVLSTKIFKLPERVKNKLLNLKNDKSNKSYFQRYSTDQHYYRSPSNFELDANSDEERIYLNSNQNKRNIKTRPRSINMSNKKFNPNTYKSSKFYQIFLNSDDFISNNKNNFLIKNVNELNNNNNNNYPIKYDIKFKIKDVELVIEYNTVREIWENIGVTEQYQYAFTEMLNNLPKNAEVENLLANEKKQVSHFQYELTKLMDTISKRESTINKLKKLDKIYEKENNLPYCDKRLLKSQSEIITNNNDLEYINTNNIEEEIYNTLKLLRLYTVNVVYNFNKFNSMYNYLISSGKINIDLMKNGYEFNKNYLLKVKTDLLFLNNSNISKLYNFSKESPDPFLLNLIKVDPNFNYKTLAASDEMIKAINSCLFILAQEDLLNEIKNSGNVNKNKKNDNISNNLIKYDDSSFNNNKGIFEKFHKEQSFFEKTQQSSLNRKIFLNNELNNNNSNTNAENKKSIKTQISDKNIVNQNEEKLKDNNNFIPLTTAEQLEKDFEFYENLKYSILKKDIEKIDNNSVEKKNKEKKESNAILTEDNISEDNVCYWYTDNFTTFSKIYRNYYERISQDFMKVFNLNDNAESFLFGVNPKILISKKTGFKQNNIKENNNTNDDNINGICGISYFFEKQNNSDNLVIKIGHLSTSETDTNMQYKIIDEFINKIKNIPSDSIEISFIYKKQNKNVKQLFDHLTKFNKFEECQKEFNFSDEGENRETIILKLKTNIKIDKNINGIFDYQNIGIISIVDKNSKEVNNNNDIKSYENLNTFNLNILINSLKNNNLYSLINHNFNINVDYSLLIKDHDNNLSSLSKISQYVNDNYLNDKKEKSNIKYAYINFSFDFNFSPEIRTVFNNILYVKYKIVSCLQSQDNIIYVIYPKNDVNIFYYIFLIKNQNFKDSFLKDKNLFNYFNKLVKGAIESNDAKDSTIWIPCFEKNVNTICNTLKNFQDINIKEKKSGKEMKIADYFESNRMQCLCDFNREVDFLFDINTDKDIIIETDFIFCLCHKLIINQYQNNIITLDYISKESFIKK